MNQEIENYNNKLSESEKQICDLLYEIICKHLQEASCKVWHGHPVWFINENPITGYNKQKKGIALLFWSGQSFKENTLIPLGKFNAAQVIYDSIEQIQDNQLKSWLKEAKSIQWDYKNIIKRKGQLEKLTSF